MCVHLLGVGVLKLFFFPGGFLGIEMFVKLLAKESALSSSPTSCMHMN